MSVARRSGLGRSIGRRFLFEWAGVGVLAVLIALTGSLARLTSGADYLVYDTWLSLGARPVSSDIVLVEIDNASIAQLGRWPWPRSLHAQLARQLAKAGAAGVVYDVLFTETAPGDESLAAALALRPAFLPVLLSPEDEAGRRSVVRPAGPLEQAAAGLGHINLEVDSDGIVRSVAMFEGDEHSRWPQLMLTVWRAIRAGTVHLSGATSTAAMMPANGGTASESRFLIPFGRRAATFQHFSFAQVLAGGVPADALRGRIVLVGATASGLYDRFSTPVSGVLGPLPGVYIHANVLDALMSGTEIEPAPAWLGALAALVPVVLLLAGFLVLPPLGTLLLSGLLSGATLGGSALLLYGCRLWLSPVPAIVALVVMYPVWNWRRLEMTMAYLRRELRELASEPYLLPEAPGVAREYGGDPLEQQMALMAQAAQRLQDMKRFVWDSLDSVPEPILVADLRGVVLIVNQAARAHFGRLKAGSAEGRPMRDAFGALSLVKPIDTSAHAAALARKSWPVLLDPARAEFAELMAQGVEVRDALGRDYVLRYARCTNAQGDAVGWIAGLFDVTALREAERQREDALRLLSHDMRSPQASIVALVETERERGAFGSREAHDMMERIERYARRALHLADAFVQLARAESQEYTFEATSLVELLIVASDEVWPQAHAKRIQIETDFADDDGAWISADGSLMTRALVNLLNNAVKYSAPDTQVRCTLATEAGKQPARVICAIRDEGYGIPAEEQARLFEPFRRFHEGKRPEVSGAGLGMAFVKTVVTRHGGEIRVDSAVDEGTTVTLSIPAVDPPV